MTARALLLVALLASASAAADDPASAFTRLRAAEDPADRIRACAELSTGALRGPRAYDALVNSMSRDLSDRVRLAAAAAALTYPGGGTLDDLSRFLKTEPGAEVRRDLITTLSTAPAHRDNPDATRVILAALVEDASPEVRLAAAAALGARGDALALGGVGRASEKDESKAVRAAARRAMLILAKPPKRKPAPQPPKPPKADAAFGIDPCPQPWGWCVCSGAIKLKPRCLTHDECRTLHGEMRRRDLACSWDGRSED